MRIIFFGNGFSIYQSNAQSNLLYAFARGFQENGCRSILVTMDNEYAEPSGFFGEVEFYIPLEQKNRHPDFVVRNFHKLLKYLNAVKFIRNLTKKEESAILLCYSGSILIKGFSFLLKKLFFDLSFIYIVEHPLRYKKRQNKALLSFHKNVFSILFDGQIFISEGLRSYFKTAKKNLVVPSMVLFERFIAAPESPFPFEYIGYCGRITLDKDGVHILIKGFEKISAKYPLLKLLIIGDYAYEVEKPYILSVIAELKLSDRIVFTGKISKNEMPAYLKNAKILALARPKNLQSETGFPTKLPEYLATGKPVVVTKVGDIPRYLRNGENAFMVEPDNCDAIANAFETILSDYEKALAVGARGQQLAKTVFSPRYQAQRVISFIKEIKDN